MAQNNVHPDAKLAKQIGLGAAVLLGLGSMVGTGVFVSLGLGAGLVGPAVIGAIVLAGGLAMCNGLSSAQLAAAYPVSGGTYEYAHRVGWPAWGGVAGVMFLVAKSASAATAALGVAGYVLNRFDAPSLQLPGAIAVVIMLTVVVLEGIRRTNTVNTVIVTATLLGLGVFISVGAGQIQTDFYTPWMNAADPGDEVLPASWKDLLYATALMFVAYTGYGRIATLGEEVHHPQRTIPIAVVVTVLICIAFYTAVAVVGLGLVGAPSFAKVTESGATLEAVAKMAGLPRWVGWAVTIAAVTALLGVILNLILGLSRVVLAMGRRGHLPKLFAKIDASGSTPGPATVLVACIIAGLVCVGSIKAAWSMSAVTVLIYYGITNAAALRLSAEARMYPRLFSWIGLVGCLGLSVFVEPIYWAFAGGLIAAALLWHVVKVRLSPTQDSGNP